MRPKRDDAQNPGPRSEPPDPPRSRAAGDFREWLLEECGGTCSIQEVTSRLKIPIQDQALIGRGHLLAVSLGGGEIRIPSCQLAADDFLPKLTGVLDALGATDSDPWTVLATLLESLEALRDASGPRSLLEVLRAGETDKALTAADFLYRTGGV